MSRFRRYLEYSFRYLFLPLSGLLLMLLVSESSDFRLDAFFSFLGSPDSAVLIPFIAFFVGMAALFFCARMLVPRARRRLALRISFVLLATYLVLIVLDSKFVKYRDSWTRAYVIGWWATPSCSECAADDPPEECLQKLMIYKDKHLRQQKIYECWGTLSVRSVEFLLAALYAAFAGLFGGIPGLLMPPKPPLRVFVSYRRRDSDRFVNEVLANRLRKWLGESNVFVDKHSIEAAENWANKIEAWCETCHVMIVVVGPAWREELEKDRETSDWVRFEIERAIRGEIRLLPVVIGGTKMPAESDLPESMASLARAQAVVFDEDCMDLGAEFRVVDKKKLKRALDKLMVAIEKLRILRV